MASQPLLTVNGVPTLVGSALAPQLVRLLNSNLTMSWESVGVEAWRTSKLCMTLIAELRSWAGVCNWFRQRDLMIVVIFCLEHGEFDRRELPWGCVRVSTPESFTQICWWVTNQVGSDKLVYSWHVIKDRESEIPDQTKYRKMCHCARACGVHMWVGTHGETRGTRARSHLWWTHTYACGSGPYMLHLSIVEGSISWACTISKLNCVLHDA